MTNELQECTNAAKDLSKKVDTLITEYVRKNRECDVLQNVIKWLAMTLMTFVLVAGIVAGIFVYGYLFSPYMYAGEITQTADLPHTQTGNVAQVIR